MHCTQTRSSRLEGEDIALRLLKTWVLHGVSVGSQEQHCEEVWKAVLAMRDGGVLPTMEELDGSEITDWHDLPPFCAAFVR